jgi:hypothetical protein
VQAKEPASLGGQAFAAGVQPPVLGARSSARPLLLVDIDGVISLFGFSPGDRPAGAFHSIEGIPHFLSTAAAENLLGLVSVFDLVWCSGWEEKAEEYLPYLLGLPRGLPFLSFEGRVEAYESAKAASDGVARVTRAHWKLEAIDGYAGAQRPLAWIDDAFDDSCHAWAAARAAPTLLVRTAPPAGLTEHETSLLGEWAARL